MINPNEVNSLIRLLDDPDSEIYEHVHAKLLSYGVEAISFLESQGFVQYEISAFCRGGLKSIHNTGYWTGRPFFGLGPSAFSYFANKRFRNVSYLHRYCRTLSEGLSPVDFEEEESPPARRRELLAIALRMREGVDLAAFVARLGPLEERDQAALLKLQEEGFLLREKERIFLSQKGCLFYDTVATEII